MDRVTSPTVFYAETSSVDYGTLLAAWQDRLFDFELTRLRRLRLERDRRDYLAAHVLQRVAGAAGTGDWSLTHADGFVACGFSGDAARAIGVDAEPRTSALRLETMTEVFTSSSEHAWLDRAPLLRPLRLVELWTVKEAYLKSRGEGFTDDAGFAVLRSLQCAPDEPVDEWATIGVRDVRTDVRARAWVRCVGEHVLAVVAVGNHDAAPRLCPMTVRTTSAEP